MKVNKFILLLLFVIALLALTVASQITHGNPHSQAEASSKITKATEKISVEEPQDCTITYYNQTENVYGNVTRTRTKYNKCFDSINQSYYDCANGTEDYLSYEIVGSQISLKNNTNCASKNSYIISIDKGGVNSKKEIDFSNWGVCVQNTENDCLAVTCGTLKGGSARNGIFNGCDGGKTCQKFLFCEDGTKVLYKSSRNEFIEEDPSFHLSKLALKEAGQ